MQNVPEFPEFACQNFRNPHGQTLYAPTTRPPNGSCLEMGTAYTTPFRGAQTAVYVYVYDFCKSPRHFVCTIPVDATFIQSYVQAVPNGQSTYKIRIMPNGDSLIATTVWSAMIYNNVKHDWDTLAVSQGFVRSDYTGWTWYEKGQCSRTLKAIQASNIAYYNSVARSGNRFKII